MAQINGKLLGDLLPNGIVRLVFLATVAGNEAPVTVKNLDTAESNFVHTYGVTPELAGWMRAELERNKVFCITMSLSDEAAATFRNVPLRKD